MSGPSRREKLWGYAFAASLAGLIGTCGVKAQLAVRDLWREAYPARNVCVSADPQGCREAWEHVETVHPWTCCRSCAVDADGGWVRP